MANLAGDLSKQIFGHSDAEQTFRPWWVVLEDYIMYSMVLMGKMVLKLKTKNSNNLYLKTKIFRSIILEELF